MSSKSENEKNKKTLTSGTRTRKYFELSISHPEMKKKDRAIKAGYAYKTKTSTIEKTPLFKQLLKEYTARCQDVKRDVSERINEATALYQCSAKNLLKACTDIVNDADEESRNKLRAVKTITDITQDKNKEKKEHTLPGVESALEKLFA